MENLEVTHPFFALRDKRIAADKRNTGVYGCRYVLKMSLFLVSSGNISHR